MLVPVATPFDPGLAPDVDAFVAHCRWLLEQGADGLAVFGTTSEATSLGVDERIALLEALVAAGIPAARLMPGTGTCALGDSVRLTAHAVGLGCGGVLMLPPFYYKGVGEEGLYASFAEVIERVGDARLRLYLYHIPPVAQVGIPLTVLARLCAAYPQALAGIKDSSGDWAHTARLLAEFPQLAVFPGSEAFLLDGLRHGGAGCITATGNVNPAGIRAVFAQWQSAGAEALQERAGAVRRSVQAYPLIAAVKALLARIHAAPGWARVRPPLEALPQQRVAALCAEAAAAGLELPPG
ncbi:MAG TPA: dihydrodipicolinate synthase family protein [Gammaproteobacteria bacterium]